LTPKEFTPISTPSPLGEGAFRKANLKVERAGGRKMKGLKHRFVHHLPAVRPASAGGIGVAPAARLAAAAPGGFGSPSAPTKRGCLKWLDVTGRAGRNARAKGSEKACPSRGSYGPEDRNRHDRAPEGAPASVVKRVHARLRRAMRRWSRPSMGPARPRGGP
jgi:hypothetical protein